MSHDEPTPEPFALDGPSHDPRRWFRTGRARTLLALSLAGVTAVALVAGSPAPTDVDATATDDIRVVAGSDDHGETTTTASTGDDPDETVADSAPVTTSAPEPSTTAPTTTTQPPAGGTAAGAGQAPSTTTTTVAPLSWQGRIFYSQPQDGRNWIWSMQPDGSDRRVEFDEALRVSPSADGRSLFYMTWYPQYADPMDVTAVDVRRRDLDGTDELVLRGGFSLSHMSLSPDGQRLALIDDAELWVVGVDGQGLRRVDIGLPPYSLHDVEPSWSPDSSRVVVSSASGTVVVDVDTEDTTVLPLAGNTPAWSSDGRHILMVSCEDDWAGVVTLEIGTGTVTHVWTRPRPAGPGCNHNIRQAAWSPDGSDVLVLFSGMDNVNEIRRIALDGSGGGSILTARWLMSIWT